MSLSMEEDRRARPVYYIVYNLCLHKKNFVCRVNFQLTPNITTSEAYCYIAQQIISRMPQWVASPNVTDSIGLTRFFVESIKQIRLGKCILLIEEMGALPQIVREDLANFIRGIFHERFDIPQLGQLMFIIAGSIELYELAAIQVSPLKNICEPPIYLPNLSEVDTTGLIADGLISLDIPQIQAEVLGQVVYSYTSGHPYLTQRIGSMLEDALAHRGSRIPDHVGDVVEQLFYQDDSLLKHLQQCLEEKPNLLNASKSLLQGNMRFSRMDEKMSQLELLGLASQNNGFWRVRNRVFEHILQKWTGDSVRVIPERATDGVCSTNQLARLLLSCPSMQDNGTREVVLGQLPKHISQAISRHSKNQVDVLNIVITCKHYPGGIDLLVEAVRVFDGGTFQMQAVDEFLNSIQDRQ